MTDAPSILTSRASVTIWTDPAETLDHLDSMDRAARAGRIALHFLRVHAASVARDVEATLSALVCDGRQDWRAEIRAWFRVRRAARRFAGMDL